MKRIIFFAYTLEMGGAEKVLIDYINILKENYDIDLVLIDKKGELLQDIPQSIKIIQLKNNSFSYGLLRYLPYFRKKKINKIVSKNQYDVAIGFMEGRSATWVADIKKDLLKLAWIHNDVNKFDIGISEKEILNSYSKIDKIIAVSEVSKNSFCEKYKINEDKIQVLYNLIDEESILKKASEEVQTNTCFTFVNVGRMRPQKRQDRLIEIAKTLKDRKYNFKIQIIGDGPEEEKIRKLVRDKKVEDVVELVGLKMNPYPYIKQADCVVVSSDFEGYSLAIKEALLLKKVIISTDVSGVSEIFENNKYGIIAKVDTKDLMNKMEGVLNNKIDIKQIEQNLENFDCGNDKIIERLKEIIEGK